MISSNARLADLDDRLIQAVVHGACDDPFAVLGMHKRNGALEVRVFAPQAESVAVIDAGTEEELARLDRIHPDGLFAGIASDRATPFPYVLELSASGKSWRERDPYSFRPTLGDMDRHLLGEGAIDGSMRPSVRIRRSRRGRRRTVCGRAPNARRVVVGDFNSWMGAAIPCARITASAFGTFSFPGLECCALSIRDHRPDGALLPKADPVSFQQEPAPSTCSMVHGLTEHPGRRGLIGERHGRHGRANFNLRGASGLLAARARQSNARL